ncbi:methylated-DNA--[protein]-cysteine S-methyltransferase [Tabrizicola oligotrophica]|uniref:Methylated-DNA--protein-cysteine methyltransferase n=1 Tax=Tabrizicola oligotrophica TaxID=2710650 RepID=A0A6M0QU07_9RHOB|nr:methylated-DNA--[protein]-cysteine S-methyltransferase [Tabrizicola oligotrophica]NEY90978.1 methylated-DNA--[protein]-cysteine S-methyltransferase [Tabrizicola oligotrophica]
MIERSRIEASLGIDTALGRLTLWQSGDRLTGLSWAELPPSGAAPTPLLAEASAQLAAYFAGRLQQFDLPLDWGTGLHEQVRRAMAAIPFGETLTYGEIAARVGAPAQSVGQACGANPLPIIIPCHRVLGAKGLGGFSARGGVETKVWLLRHEGAAGLLI